MSRLKKLRDVINHMNTYRFFSSSLLLVYEGNREVRSQNDLGVCQKEKTSVDVRMIDFANLTHSGFVNDPIHYEGPDEGYIYGLTSLIRFFESIQ